MKRFKNYLFVIFICCLIFVTSCSNTKTQITWADVNQKFMELEQERASIMDSIAKEKQERASLENSPS